MSGEIKNEIKVFDFEGAGVRTVLSASGEPMFVAKDVCDVLGLSNATVVVGGLDADEVTKLNLGSREGVTNLVTESGLYHLIFKSRKAEAKKFRRWVTGEVLPMIRKQGFYSVIDDSELMTLPNWLDAQGVDVTREKAKAKTLLRDAWEASKLMGYRVQKVDAKSGFVKFPESVLSMAEEGEALELGDGVLTLLRGMECGSYSVADMASELGVAGTDARKRSRVGWLLQKYLGDIGGGRELSRVVRARKVSFEITDEEVKS